MTPPVIDHAELMERVDGDRELLLEIVDLFLADLPVRVSRIHRCLEEGDLEEMHRVAHALKGSCANLSAKQATLAARTIDELARNDSTDGLAEAIDHLSRIAPALETELRSFAAPESEAV